MWGAACVAYETAAGEKLFDVSAALLPHGGSCSPDSGRGVFGLGGSSGGSTSRGDGGERALLRLMVDTLGPPPRSLLDTARDRALARYAASLPASAPGWGHAARVPGLPPLQLPEAWLPPWLRRVLAAHGRHAQSRRVRDTLCARLQAAAPHLRSAPQDVLALADFLTPLLEWEPSARPSAYVAARHAFLR